MRTSKTPGCTGTINYFALGDPTPVAHLVDLPGYGFAKVSKRDQRQWSQIMSSFLASRGFLTLRRVIVLIDARRGPTEGDWRLMELLSISKVTFQLVLTKADTVSELECQARVGQLFSELARWTTRPRPTHMPVVHIVSSKTGGGIAELQSVIASAAGCIANS